MSVPSSDDFLRLSDRIRVLPIIHGSGDFAVRVREELLSGPMTAWPCRCRRRSRRTSRRPSNLPAVSVVVQRDAEAREAERASATFPSIPARASSRPSDRDGRAGCREFIDLETPRFEPVTGVFPDPYALKRVSPGGSPPPSCRRSRRPKPGQHADRIAWMAAPPSPARSGAIVDPARLLAARLALDPRRVSRRLERRGAGVFFAPIADLRRRSADADLRPRRAALHHRPVRARPARADARRKPVDRRRQGDGARGPRSPARTKHPRRWPSESRRSCCRSTSATSATCR